VSSTPNLRVEIDPEAPPELIEGLTQIWVDVTNAGGAVGFVPPVTASDIQTVAREAFRRAVEGPDHLIVGFEAEEPVGFCFLEQRPGPLFKHWAYVKRLMVHPGVQGHGLGGRMLDEIHQLARDVLGLKQLHLTVRGGTGTDNFYTARGWKEVATIPDAIRLSDDEMREEIYLVKRL
jgi:GNAT superfamily N-acetyltransferase